MLPDTDGRWVCARIRAISQTIPILPYTEHAETLAVLAAFACLDPLPKRAAPETIQSILGAALQQEIPRALTNPVAAWICTESAQALRRAEAALEQLRVVVFATSELARPGLVDVFAAQARVLEAHAGPTLRGALAGKNVTAVVAYGSDYDLIRDTVRAHGAPLVLIAGSPEQQRLLRGPEIAAVLPERDPAINTRLRAAVRAIAAGEPIPAAPASGERGGLVPSHVPAGVRQYFREGRATPREAHALWFLGHGLATGEIAARMGVTAGTAKTHLDNVQRRLGLDRDGLRAWVMARLVEANAIDGG